ncbi:MAG: serine protease [Bradyrhizobiaceae bacterium]|nr:MAG: serine protease [Bradyrhizobiaceae bacterium]
MVEVIGLTSNVLKRSVRIGINGGSATAFTTEVDSRHYLITAKHVVATAKENATVKLWLDGAKIADAEVTVLRCADPIDIAVLVPKKVLTVTHALPANSGGMQLGQDVYFVGFPYGDPSFNTITPALENIGFVRKAIWSSQQILDGAVTMYFDGRNNEGFSGAPVVFLENGKPRDFKVAGVISGFRSDLSEVLNFVEVQEKDVTDEDRALNRVRRYRDGSLGRLVPTGHVVTGNTGIVVGYDIKHAVDLIRAKGAKGPEVN